MKKKFMSIFMVIAITIFQFAPTIVNAGSIGRVGSGKRVTFTEIGTSTEQVASTTNIEEYINSKKDEFIEDLENANVTVDLNYSNIDPNTLFTTTPPYKYAGIDTIESGYAMIEGVLTQVYTVNYGITTVINGSTSSVYIIQFNSNGGSPVNSQSITGSGYKVSRPTNPTKDNYSFAGWYSDKELTNEWNFDTVATSSMTLYAKWESEDVIRTTTTNYHTRVTGKLSITGDDSYTKNYNSGETYLDGNYNDENIATIISSYKNDMNSIASKYKTTINSFDEGVTDYYYEAHDEITQTGTCPTDIFDEGEYPDCKVVINTILDKYQIYTINGTSKVEKVKYTLDDEKGNQISFKDYEGIVFVFNSTDILNLTDEELQGIAEELGVDVEEIKAMSKETIEGATNAVKGKGTLVGLYDFSISDGTGFKEESTDGFIIRIKMTEEMKKYNDFKIAFLKDDGTLEDLIKLTQNGEYLEGTLPHLSRYVVIGNNVEITPNRSNNPQTGDNISFYIGLLVFSIVGLAIARIYTKKKIMK